jgi:hypothetical protein
MTESAPARYYNRSTIFFTFIIYQLKMTRYASIHLFTGLLFDKVLNKWNHFVLQRYMGNLIQNRQRVSTTRINERCICKADNITIVPMYHTRDSLSYQVSRCNYCREEWAEYWISYRYIFSPLIYQHQQKGG